MQTELKTRRICAGEYEVSDGARTVTISRNIYWDGPGWVAVAEWDQHSYTDPLSTKREAVESAQAMLVAFRTRHLA